MEVQVISHALAKTAVETWHYSKRYPAAPVLVHGVYDPQFVGAIVYGRGATPEIGKPFGLDQRDVCELTRVALTDHTTPTSRMLSVSLRLLKKARPELRLVVSFADTAQGHLGVLYQATNWLYLGEREVHAFRVHGQVIHPRTLYSRYGKGGQSIPWLRANIDPNAERIKTPPKLKYVYLFDKSLAIRGLSFPKREKC